MVFITTFTVENTRLNDCYFDTKDWRACTKEVSPFRDEWASATLLHTISNAHTFCVDGSFQRVLEAAG